MYERFTDRARKVIKLARRQAYCRYSPALETEHILLGLFEEGSGVAANVLRGQGVDWQNLWAAASACFELHPPPADVAAAEPPLTGWNAIAKSFWRFLTGRRKQGLPFTTDSKRLIEHAMEESRSLGHNYVGTEHLLLGMLRQPDSAASQVLVENGVTLERVRHEVLEMLGCS